VVVLGAVVIGSASVLWPRGTAAEGGGVALGPSASPAPASTDGADASTGAPPRDPGPAGLAVTTLEEMCTSESTSAPAAEPRPGAGIVSQPVAAAYPQSYAAVVGDSYSSGWNGVGEGSAGWPAILGAAKSWRISNLAVPGTGFVNPGWTSEPIRVQVAAAIRLKPGIVIVAGGHNDESYAASTVIAAADVALDRLRAGLPHAVIVIVGPIWPDSNPDATLVALRDHLRAKAGALGALFVDPIAGGWFSGANHDYIGYDGTHPTAAGYRRIATLLLASFKGVPGLAATPKPKIAAVAPTPAPTATPEPREPAMQPGDRRACPA